MRIVALDDNDNIIVEFPLENKLDKGSASMKLGALAEVRVWEYLRDIGIESTIVSLCSPAIKGVDIVLSNGTTIEVKAARTSYNTNGTENYSFGARKTPADFIIVLASDYDDFYIIPRSFINPGVNRIYPNAARWQYVRNNWELLMPSTRS